MCEELKKEIEVSKNLPRAERRIKERKLQKKYNDKSIRILSGKKFKKSECLTKEDRRLLMKDKNLLREILKIIKKYLPKLTTLISELTDKRNKSYIKYKIKTLIITRLFGLICGITSMTEINRRFNKEKAIANLSSICGQNLKEIPDWQTIQDSIERLDIHEIENIRKYIVNALIRSKMFDKYKYNNAFQLVVDATGISSHNYNLNGNCTSKTTTNKKGEKTEEQYHKGQLQSRTTENKEGEIIEESTNEYIKKYDRKDNNIIEYIEYVDENTGVYPLTEDLKTIIQERGNYVGWWDSSKPGFIMKDTAGNPIPGLNTEIAWLFMCGYIE